MTTQIISHNVLILPPDDVSSALIQVSALIHRQVPSKVVLGESALPHLSVFHVKYPESHKYQVHDTLTKLSGQIERFKLRLKPISLVLGTVFLDVDGVSRELVNLHNQVVDQLNPLRNGLQFEEELSLPGITPLQVEMVQTYGHSVVKKTYQPHITLSRPMDSTQLSQAAALVPTALAVEFEVQQIHLGVRGPNGTCPEIVSSYTLNL